MKSVQDLYKPIVVVLLVYIAVVATIPVLRHSRPHSTTKIALDEKMEDAVYISVSGPKSKTYHKDEGCSYLMWREESLSEGDARKLGYKPCAVCAKE